MPVDSENSWSWKQLVPTNASWWELAGAAITVVFAFRHAAISLFYARFNVSPEEIGLGLTTVALQSAVFVVGLYIAANWLLVAPIVYIYARVGARAGRRLKTRVKRLGTWLAIGFLLHRATVIVSVIAFFWLVGTKKIGTQQTISLGGLDLPLDSVVVVGFFFAVWLAALGLLNNRLFRKSAAESTPDENRDADRRFALRVTLGVLVPLTMVFIAAPLNWAVRQAKAVSEGRGVSAPLLAPWQATPATITWLGEPSDGVVAKAATHCLMYLGQANGVTVLFDVDDQVTFRLPTAKLVVFAVPLQSPGGSAVRSPCVK